MQWVWYIAAGVSTTLQYALLSMVGSTIIGLIIAGMRMSSIRPVKRCAAFYVSFFRGTPSLLHLSMVFYAAPGLLGIHMGPMVAGVLAFSLHSGAYTGEILRSGIRAVEPGQLEMCQTLGIPAGWAFIDIVLPQAIRHAFPALTGEAINVLKDTALISVIGETDIMRRSNLVAAQQYSYFGPLVVAAICYYALALLLQAVAHYVERRIDYHRN
ncbi:MAG: amino acid ABC transporter permease [Myxococcota bacterium]